jgi:hypothetical protein
MKAIPTDKQLGYLAQVPAAIARWNKQYLAKINGQISFVLVRDWPLL